ncbi:bifunctional biotin--[acetyl-CoA-carboxylase] ligase/biotin operon repressor BirA [Candidatus Palibaumannia cicadellinicola]|nr:bifunctional biotin--[acetyl-CoA-carboxylase] ligase/biotin operon repressor BirA [Candidatus Baumannia cicadellinicola]
MTETSIPLKLINILSDGNVHSCKQFGEKLYINSLNINKHIQTVYDWGIDLLKIPGQGQSNNYRLHTPLQLLDKQVIQMLLPTGRIVVLSVINSTNQYLIDRIAYLQPGDACVAEYQLHGRGRRGRKWISQFGNNIYLSIYWRLEQQGPATLIGLSLMVGIIVAEILQNIGASNVQVKWPNDLYLNNRKLAGILVETSGRSGDIGHIVIGTGINLAMPIMEKRWINLKEIGIDIVRNKLVAELTNALRNALLLFERDGFAPFILRWQALDYLYNKPVKLLRGDGKYSEIIGIARGINTQGALLLEQQGQINTYINGEISLRSYT